MSDPTRRLSLWSLAALVGAALLVVAGCGGKTSASGTTGTATTPATIGGTYVVELNTDVDYTDPGLDYLTTGWEIQYAVGCKLLNYPDRNGAQSSQLQPEVAAAFPTVSDGGKTPTPSRSARATASTRVSPSPRRASRTRSTVTRARCSSRRRRRSCRTSSARTT